MSEPNHPELLPCPFCGGMAIPFLWADHFGCADTKCGAYAANLTAEQWNTRATPPTPRDVEAGMDPIDVAKLLQQRDALINSLAEALRWEYDFPPSESCGCKTCKALLAYETWKKGEQK